MRERCLAMHMVAARAAAMPALALVAALAAGPVAAQEAALALTDAPAWTPPRMPWGDPDFQGVWRYEATIPFERPAEHAGRAVLTEAEMAEIARVEAELAARRLAGLDGEAVGRASIDESPSGRAPSNTDSSRST